MTSDDLRDLLGQEPAAQALLDAFRRDVDPEGTGGDLDEALDRNLRQAMAYFDPDAVLPRTLALRLHGPGVDGRLPNDALTDVLVPFRRELDAAAASSGEVLGLDLVGFGRGSAVLYLAPSPRADVQPSDDQAAPALTAGPDHLDNALAVVTDLHIAAETAGDLLRFAGRANLVRSFASLADALDKHELDLDVQWRSGDGSHRNSSLTRVGRAYARTFLRPLERDEESTLTGRVVNLAITGTFGVKPSLRGAVVEVHTDGEQALLHLRLELGQTVSVRLRRHETTDSLGSTVNIRNELVGLVSKGEARLPGFRTGDAEGEVEEPPR